MHDRHVTLLARLEAILTARGMSQRALGRAAGLDERHVGVLMGRLRNDPNAGVEHRTLAALARAGGVSLSWLSSGEGDSGLDTPLESAIVPTSAPELTVEREEQPEYSESRFPVFRNMPNWRRIEAGARALAKDVPEWVWSDIRDARPFQHRQPISSGMIADLANWWLRHMSPPE